MANCSFISATEARNLARNNTLLWTEICEVQTQILAAIDGDPCAAPPVAGAYSVLVNDGTPMTSTQSILSVAVTAGGSGFSTVVTSAVINANGTGGTAAAVTPIVSGTTVTGFTVDVAGSGYTPVDVTAALSSPYNLLDAQDETDYDGAGGNGTFLTGGTGANVATGYFMGEDITLSEMSTVLVDSVTDAGQRVTIAGQDETDYPGTGPPDGGFAGGSGPYAVSDTITLVDGTVITVDAEISGVVTEFTVTTSGTNSLTSVALRIQSSTSGGGSGFSITTGTANETIVGVVDTFTVSSGATDPFFLGGQVTQTSTTGIGAGFALVPTTPNNASIIAHGGVVAVLTPIVGGSGVITNVVINTPGTGYIVGNPVLFTHPSGSGATAFVAAIGGSGEITAITITAGGAGYTQVVATVTVTAPGGATPALAFTGTVTTLAGVVTGIAIIEGGAGYADLLPTVVASGTGTGATFTTEIAAGALTAVNVVTGGSGYSQTPTLTVYDAGVPPLTPNATATLVPTVGTNTFGTDPSNYNDVLIGQSSDPVISDQIQFVLDYFTSLGYNIRAQTNSATSNTIQWSIIW